MSTCLFVRFRFVRIEIMSFPILLRGQNDFNKTMENIKRIFVYSEIDYYEIISVKGSILTKLINLIYLFYYATVYRVVLFRTVPLSVKSIDHMPIQKRF